MKKKQGNGLKKAAAEKKPALLLTWRKLRALPARILILGVVAVILVILIIAVFFSGSPRQEAPPKTPAPAADVSPQPGGENFLERPLGPPPPQPRKAIPPDQEERPTIQSIRFHPRQATRMDTLKAEAVLATPADPGRITYAYMWKVNSRIVAGATEAALNLAAFKKGDLVTVTVTPYDGDKAGFSVESPVTLIYGIPPSLDLQATSKKTKVGEPLELQLVSLHPDSEGIAFSLEAPLVPGMSIDSQTGKITWIIPPSQKGTISFGAAVEDTDKTKVTKTFDMKIE